MVEIPLCKNVMLAITTAYAYSGPPRIRMADFQREESERICAWMTSLMCTALQFTVYLWLA